MTKGVPVELYADLLAKGLIAKDWVPFKGPQGGVGWQSETGEVRYQKEKPETERKATIGHTMTAERVLEEFERFKDVPQRLREHKWLGTEDIRLFKQLIFENHANIFNFTTKMKELFPQKAIWSRLKNPHALKDKLIRYAKDPKAHPLPPTDLVAMTIVAEDVEDLEHIQGKLSENFKLAEEDRTFMEKPSLGFYRAVHNAVVMNGQLTEVQVMTKTMRRLKEWAHDMIYNGTREGAMPDKKILDYAVKLGNWVHAKDSGKDPGKLPRCPHEVHAHKACFNLNEEKELMALKRMEKLETIPWEVGHVKNRYVNPAFSKATSKELDDFLAAHERATKEPWNTYGRFSSLREAPEIEIPIENIRARQQDLKKLTLEAAVKEYSSIPSGNAWQVDSLFWVQNGNHRVAAAKLLGEKTIRMHVLKL